MLERFEANVKALEACRPDIYRELEAEIQSFRTHPEGDDRQSFQFFTDASNNTNLLFRSRNGQMKLPIHSDKPMDEVRSVFEKADLKYPQMILFFGQGLGHIPQYFFKNRPTSNAAMLLIEPRPQLFLRSLCVYDWQPIFEEQRFFFVFSDKLGVVQAKLASVMSGFTTVNRHLKILATPSALQLDPQFFNSVAKECLKIRDHTTILVGNSIEDSFIGYKNVLENIPLAVKNPGILPLKNAFESETIISVAAGPAAEEHWDRLREIQRKIPIVACDVLVRPMLAKGIIPDIVCAIERTPVVTGFFKGVEIPKETMLVGPLLLRQATFEAFQGLSLAYCPVVQNARGIGLDFLGEFAPGSSAGNLNLALAVLMGFKNIIMVGHNLAFGLDRRSHIRGTGLQVQEKDFSQEEIEKKSGGLNARTQDGQSIVATTDLWNLFRGQIENLVARNPDVRWINTAPKGAAIRGVELLSFSDALKQLQPKELNFYSRRNEIIKMPDQKSILERQANIRFKLEESKARSEFWLEKSRELVGEIKKWEKKIKEKEVRGKNVSFEFLDRALDQILDLKVKAVNEDFIFHNAVVSIILPAHIAFERELNQMPGEYTDNYKLKRDFLLRHLQYFGIWEKWIPLIIEELERALAALSEESLKVDSSLSKN